MKRRSFFAILFGGLLARFLPKPKLLGVGWNGDGGNLGRVDCFDLRYWGHAPLIPESGFDHIEQQRVVAEWMTGYYPYVYGSIQPARIPMQLQLRNVHKPPKNY